MKRTFPPRFPFAARTHIDNPPIETRGKHDPNYTYLRTFSTAIWQCSISVQSVLFKVSTGSRIEIWTWALLHRPSQTEPELRPGLAHPDPLLPPPVLRNSPTANRAIECEVCLQLQSNLCHFLRSFFPSTQHLRDDTEASASIDPIQRPLLPSVLPFSDSIAR